MGLFAVFVGACGDDVGVDGEGSSSTNDASTTTTAATSSSGADTTNGDPTATTSSSSEAGGSSSEAGESSSSTGEPVGPPAECPSELPFQVDSFAFDGGIPFGVALFDADGIGGIDLAVTDVLGRVLVYRGMGDGTFATPTVIELGGNSQALDLLAADFDDDGIHDLLVADYDLQSTAVRFLFGIGDGTFTQAPAIPVGARSTDLQLGDYDGDGTQDFTVQLLEDFMPSNVLVMLGDGDGTFTEAAELGVQGEPAAFGSGDLDGDGAPDLLGVHADPAEIVLRRNQGGGSFGDAGTLAYEPVGNAAIIADLDNDGLGEIVVSSGTDDMPGGIHLWSGSAELEHGAPLVVDAQGPVDALLAHDVSGDGWPDLVVGAESSASAPGLWVLLTDPSGIGTCAFTVALAESPRTIAAADLDDDGDQDLVAALGPNPMLAVLLQEP